MCVYGAFVHRPCILFGASVHRPCIVRTTTVWRVRKLMVHRESYVHASCMVHRVSCVQREGQSRVNVENIILYGGK
jgi:hypothetical protein